MYGFPHSGNNTSGGGGMKDKFLMFLRKNGFLLFLFICVCVVAVGTLMIATRELATTDKDNLDELVILEDSPNIDNLNTEDGDKEVSLDTTLDETKSEEEPETKPEKEPEEANEPDKPEEVEEELDENDEVDETLNESVDDLEFVEEEEDDYEDEDVKLVEENQVLSMLPVDGEVLTEYTFDSLIYSKTLEEWRGHLGIDIKAAEGTKVSVPLDGVVKEAYKDDLWGMVIVIDHGNGLETKYANLGTLDMVKSGLKVNKGDHISTVGKSASIEMLMDSHLHYEAIKNGKNVDPRSISK